MSDGGKKSNWGRLKELFGLEAKTAAASSVPVEVEPVASESPVEQSVAETSEPAMTESVASAPPKVFDALGLNAGQKKDSGAAKPKADWTDLAASLGLPVPPKRTPPPQPVAPREPERVADVPRDFAPAASSEPDTASPVESVDDESRDRGGRGREDRGRDDRGSDDRSRGGRGRGERGRGGQARDGGRAEGDRGRDNRGRGNRGRDDRGGRDSARRDDDRGATEQARPETAAEGEAGGGEARPAGERDQRGRRGGRNRGRSQRGGERSGEPRADSARSDAQREARDRDRETSRREAESSRFERTEWDDEEDLLAPPEIVDEVVLDIETDELDDSPERGSTSDRGEAQPDKRRRRRRRRRGGRRDDESGRDSTSRDEARPARDSHLDDDHPLGFDDSRSSLDPASLDDLIPDGPRTETDSLTGETRDVSDESRGGEESDDSKRRRRRRRGGRGRRDRESGPRRERDAEVESVDGISGELDEPHDLHSSDEQLTSAEDAEIDASFKSMHRGIPSWNETIGMIVAANMENRAKNPQSGGGHRGRGRGRGRGRNDRPRHS